LGAHGVTFGQLGTNKPRKVLTVNNLARDVRRERYVRVERAEALVEVVPAPKTGHLSIVPR
jgi:hypothetical protein